MKRRLRLFALIVFGLALLDFGAATWIISSTYDATAELLRDPARLRGEHLRIEVQEETPKPRTLGHLELFSAPNSAAFRLALADKKHSLELTASGRETHVVCAETRAHFASGATDFAGSRRALADLPPKVGAWQRFTAALWLHPMVVSVRKIDGEYCWDLRFAGGRGVVACRDSLPREIRFRSWLATLRRGPLTDAALAVGPGAPAHPVQVEAAELDRSFAAVLRILALWTGEVPREPDTLRREGDGSLEIAGGRRVLRLRGKPYDIGLQHGRLLAPNIQRLCERVIYGVGFYYSLEKGSWFAADAADLVDRQRPHIAPEYFEEMRGLADGAGLPLATVQAANIFPEFFHCSGAAVFGKATRDGTLLHARVLDYMTEVGLQDEAVTMAIEREGARRIVNVGYAGFIGSVTGMNEKQVAIGEMGGRGEGQWDGTPMAQLVRGALENCDTLEQALDYMRQRRRTCEYYYLISDGKSLTARGVAATPEKFDVVAPAEVLPQLPEPVDDAVLLSAGDRYQELVKRVREQYGRLGPEELQRIVARPVAMRSNLHTVIFEPAALTLWIANASRHRPACEEPYSRYTWEALFPLARLNMDEVRPSRRDESQ